MTDPTRRVLLGRIHGAFGVRGELRVESFTDPGTELFRYQPWTLRDAQGREQMVDGARGRATPKGVVATLPGVEDRDAADAMRGVEIWVPRSVLPPPGEDEFYWVDLEGLRVRNVDGVDFGTVAFVFSTGANDVLVVRDDARERMIPFVRPDYVRAIDLDAGTILVDWDPDF